MEVMNECNLFSTPQRVNYWENCKCDIGYRDCYTFSQSQFYAGNFFRDSFHGQGDYTWKGFAVYEGGFYSNFKEGYASLSFPNNSYFEGLFIRNKPFGPGVLTYANGRQDAGFWRGEKLVRLSRAVDFIIPRLAPTSAAKIKLLQFRRLVPLEEENCDAGIFRIKKCGYPFENLSSPYSRFIYDPRSAFFDRQAFEKAYFVNFRDLLREFDAIEKSGVTDVEEFEFGSKENPFPFSLPLPCLCQKDDSEEDDFCDTVSVRGEYELGILGYLTKYGTLEGPEKKAGGNENGKKNYEEELEEEEEEDLAGFSKPPKIVSWNRTELCTEMIKQMFRYRAFEDKLSFDVAKLMLGTRTAFGKTGYKEKECVHFLKMCSIGPAHAVKDLLCSYKISEELMDARGNNSLMFAAAADQVAVIDVLLNYGVDINSFNDEGLTPLNLCLLRRLAQANGIFCWETAFLPKEIDTLPGDSSQLEEWQTQESFESLDRIFGDGMSINDSKTPTTRLLSLPIPSASLESNEVNAHRNQNLNTDKSLTDPSQITVTNLTKSPGSYSLINCAKDDQLKPSLTSKSITSPGIQETPNASQIIGTTEETPRVNARMIPKSFKRDEFEKSIKKTSRDRYLFEITFERNPKNMEVSKRKGSDQKKEVKTEEEKEEEEEDEEYQFEMETLYYEMIHKIAEIDKTIEKLLRQGADPNVSEVPKPSIHLAIYTKDLNTVHNLLLYGADPNSRLYSNEGLLTPLHVVVLQKSAQEFVDICGLLLNLGANPNKETHPEFSLGEEEKEFLDFERGRTPLELLCMRPDLEYADPDGNLIKIGLMLARESEKKQFYNGHSCLTLAMHSGNIKLLKALLEANLFDPNEILEKNRGTALHVLVSRELQRKTCYENSIKLCDLLIKKGANPLKKFHSPFSLRGNCIDYGYREIEAEKEERSQKAINGRTENGRASRTNGKSDRGSIKSDREKTESRDYLKDHLKVVEYLEGKKTKRGVDLKKKKHKDRSQDDVSREFQKSSKKGSEAQKEKAASEGKDAERKVDEDQKDKTKKKDNEDLKEAKDKRDARKDQKDMEKAGLEGGKTEKKGKDGGRKQRRSKNLEVDNKDSEEKKGLNNKNVKSSSSKLPEKTLSKHLGTGSESFPEKLRQNLLKKYGNCINIDINEFLIPYVVLRNGDLYYMFHGEKPSRQEQYSLI